jgi:hypothetical protein
MGGLIMFKKPFVTLLFIFVWSGFWLIPSCTTTKTDNSNASANTHRTTLLTKSAESYKFNFPSFAEKYGPPPWWKGETFQLSQDYPKDYDGLINSPCPETECTWKKDENNFKEHPDKYLQEVIKYAYQGNLETDWVVQKNTEGRKWFHAPFMHLDIVDPLDQKIIKEKVAREFIHGLTMERPACISELLGKSSCEAAEKRFQSWAISFYNERGASYIGKVWNEMIDPSRGLPDPQNFASGFPDGAVAVKLLFTQAPLEEVKYLEGSIKWEADTALRVKEKLASEEECKNAWEKCFPALHLLQIDVAVKHKNDPNAPTGWVFATFTSDKTAPPFIDYTFPSNLSNEEIEQKKAWLRIEPLGLMFGNDPDVLKGGEINESWLNKELGIAQHYGCGDDSDPFKRRLNGPVDNPQSSCISCHAQAETPKDLSIGDVDYPKMKCVEEGENNIAFWFRNINPDNRADPTFTASTKGRMIFTLDYSLQLREGLRRFCVENPGKCRLTYKKGGKFSVITKDGDKTYTIQ